MTSTRELYCIVQTYVKTIHGTGVLTFYNDSDGHSLLSVDHPCDINNPAQVQQRFLDKLSSEFDPKDIKALALPIVDMTFSSFRAAYSFRRACYEFCKKHGIFFCLETSVSHALTAAVSRTKTMVDEGKKILVIQTTFGSAASALLIRENGHYRVMHMTAPETPTQQWKKKLLGKEKYEKIVLMRGKEDIQFHNGMKELFKNENLVVYNEDLAVNPTIDGVLYNVAHKMGEKINPYQVASYYMNNFEVKMGNTLLFAYSPEQTLPYEGSAVIDVNPGKSITLFSDGPYERIQEVKLSTFKCKKVKIILKVDQNAFYDFKVEPINDDKKLDQTLSDMNIGESTTPLDKPRIIFDKQSFSILLNTEGKEHAVDANQKIPIYIAFTEEKNPIIGEGAKEIYEKKPESVVFDIIKLCSISNADVMSPKWNFKIEKEDESLMITVDTVDGKKRLSVEFLLALILKHGLEIAKKESGKKMVDEIEIGFDGFVANEMLKKNFEKASKLIKINTVFV